VRRVCREPNLGPWTAGVICLQGLGRHEHGLVGDLGLIRLCGHLLGRPATPEDTAALLEPWGEWAGLASNLYLHHPLARQRGRLRAAALAGD
jgi:3-methyladenine DNA glycosylase/8-oxoguanine DNA glycosylase